MVNLKIASANGSLRYYKKNHFVTAAAAIDDSIKRFRVPLNNCSLATLDSGELGYFLAANSSSGN